ncbi:PREDICTED: uncharacterized protein LOC105565783 [Vollenhovia emeryi]|uniref:uncharacterized protein LOC105565783 n=1 Tax=Vollenhovia emeryi TaxID=411798 RepID=UPI0005F426C8|nr:PREDICTED: uncharacterized protein LOC105565783 [Vollenhovia emeryi]
MENKEIAELRELKARLLEKAIHLRDQLKDREENGRSEPIDLDTFSTPPPDDRDEGSSKSLSTRYKAKLCEITGQMTGITFKDVDRKWLRDDTYTYTAKMITKTISLNVELIVTLKGDDFKIEDIMCHFINVPDCYMLEVSPWFQKITIAKNFSLLMSALSDYNENSLLRAKILRNFESNGYFSVEHCTQDTGGMFVYVHSPVNTEKNYAIFQWTMKFLDLTWRIEHFFTVKSTDIGVEFSEKNRSLLKEFCKIGLTKNLLVELWERLRDAIDAYTEETI